MEYYASQGVEWQVSEVPVQIKDGLRVNPRGIGMIRTKKIKELPITIIDGDRSSRYPKRGEFRKKGILFLNTANIVQNRLDLTEANYVSSEKFDEIRKGRLQRYDIVMTTRGSIGKVALFDSNPPAGLINAQMLILRADGEVLDQKFLFYQFCSDDFQIKLSNFASGSAQPQLPIVDLKEIEIGVLPPLPTQRKIGAILANYDNLIENNTRRINILEEMAQTIYREWFVEYRFLGHENVKMVESELGLMPHGWEVKRLDEIAQLLRGRSYRTENLVEEGKGLPFLNLKNIDREGGFRLDGLKWYDGKFRETQVAFSNDIIMALTDMTQERRIVARSARVPNLGHERYVFSMDLLKIQPDEGIQPDFLCALLRYSSIADKLKEHANGTTVLHLSPSLVQSSRLALPTSEIRQRYSEISKRIHQQHDLLERKNSNLRKTRDMLLPKLISGELDVSELDINTVTTQ